jgi:predicted  nucleic acid-binding Zn-ribbon protein
MAEVTNELMYELLKKLNARFDRVDASLAELRAEANSLLGTMIAIQQDIHNMYTTLSRHELRLDRIENRLELRELQEAQSRFEPHP